MAGEGKPPRGNPASKRGGYQRSPNAALEGWTSADSRQLRISSCHKKPTCKSHSRLHPKPFPQLTGATWQPVSLPLQLLKATPLAGRESILPTHSASTALPATGSLPSLSQLQERSSIYSIVNQPTIDPLQLFSKPIDTNPHRGRPIRWAA